MGYRMVSKGCSGLEVHESGGVKIAARTEGVFCFADGTIVLTNEAVRDIAEISAAAKAASDDGRERASRSGRSPRSPGSWRVAAATRVSNDGADVR
jgi:hypothetical protein